jgi:hypothetical protein
MVAAFDEDTVAQQCGACYEVTFQGKDKHGNDDGLSGKRMIAKVSNTGQKGEYQMGGHMDILLPGGGEGLFHGCSASMYPQFGGYTVNGEQRASVLKNYEALWNESQRGENWVWGKEYGGVQSMEGCSRLPEPFQESCRIKFGWGGGRLGGENKTWVKQIPCPRIMEERMN